MYPDDFIIQLLTFQETTALDPGLAETVWNMLFPTFVAFIKNKLFVISFSVVFGSLGIARWAAVYRSRRRKHKPARGLQAIDFCPPAICEKNAQQNVLSTSTYIIADSEKSYEKKLFDQRVPLYSCGEDGVKVNTLKESMKWQYTTSDSPTSIYRTVSRGNASTTIPGESIFTDNQTSILTDVSKSDKTEPKTGLPKNSFGTSFHKELSKSDKSEPKSVFAENILETSFQKDPSKLEKIESKSGFAKNMGKSSPKELSQAESKSDIPKNNLETFCTKGLSKSDTFESKFKLQENISLRENKKSSKEAMDYPDPSANIIVLKRSIFSKTNAQIDKDIETTVPMKKNIIKPILVSDKIQKSETPSANFLKSFTLSSVGHNKNIEKQSSVHNTQCSTPLIYKFPSTRNKPIEENSQNLRFHAYGGTKLLRLRTACKKCPGDGKCIIHRGTSDMICRYRRKLMHSVKTIKNDVVIKERKDVPIPQSPLNRFQNGKDHKVDQKLIGSLIHDEVNCSQEQTILLPGKEPREKSIMLRPNKISDVTFLNMKKKIMEVKPKELCNIPVQRSKSGTRQQIESPNIFLSRKSQCNRPKEHKMATVINPNTKKKVLNANQKLFCDAFSNEQLLRPLLKRRRASQIKNVFEKYNELNSHSSPSRLSPHIIHDKHTQAVNSQISPSRLSPDTILNKFAQKENVHHHPFQLVHGLKESSFLEKQSKQKSILVKHSGRYQTNRIKSHIDNSFQSAINRPNYKNKATIIHDLVREGSFKQPYILRKSVPPPNTYAFDSKSHECGEFRSNSYKLPNQGMKSLRSFLDEKEKTRQCKERLCMPKQGETKKPYTRIRFGTNVPISSTSKKAKFAEREDYCLPARVQTDINDERHPPFGNPDKKCGAGQSRKVRSVIKPMGMSCQPVVNNKSLPIKKKHTPNPDGKRKKSSRQSLQERKDDKNGIAPFTAEKVVLNFTDLYDNIDISEIDKNKVDPGQELLNLSNEWNDAPSTKLDGDFLDGWTTDKGIEHSHSISIDLKSQTSQQTKPPSNSFSKKYPSDSRKPPCYPSTNISERGKGKTSSMKKNNCEMVSKGKHPFQKPQPTSEMNTKMCGSKTDPRMWIKPILKLENSINKRGLSQPIQASDDQSPNSDDGMPQNEPHKERSGSSVAIRRASVYSSSSERISSFSVLFSSSTYSCGKENIVSDKKRCLQRDQEQKIVGKNVSGPRMNKKRKHSREKNSMNKCDDIKEVKSVGRVNGTLTTKNQQPQKKMCMALSAQNKGFDKNTLKMIDNSPSKGTLCQKKKNVKKSEDTKEINEMDKKTSMIQTKKQGLSSKILTSLNALRKETIASKNKMRPALVMKKDQSKDGLNKRKGPIQKKGKSDGTNDTIANTQDEINIEKSKGTKESPKLSNKCQTILNDNSPVNNEEQDHDNENKDKGISEMTCNTKSRSQSFSSKDGQENHAICLSEKRPIKLFPKNSLQKPNILKLSALGLEGIDLTNRHSDVKLKEKDVKKKKKASPKVDKQNRTMKIQYCPVLFRASSPESISISESSPRGSLSLSKDSLNISVGTEKQSTNKVIDTTVSIFTDSDVIKKQTPDDSIKNNTYQTQLKNVIEQTPFAEGYDPDEKRNQKGKIRTKKMQNMINVSESQTKISHIIQKWKTEDIKETHKSEQQRDVDPNRNDESKYERASVKLGAQNQSTEVIHYDIAKSDSLETCSQNMKYNSLVLVNRTLKQQKPSNVNKPNTKFDAGDDMVLNKQSDRPVKLETGENNESKEDSATKITKNVSQTSQDLNKTFVCNKLPCVKPVRIKKTVIKQSSQRSICRSRTVTGGEHHILVNDDSSESLSLTTKNQYASYSMSDHTLNRYLVDAEEGHHKADDSPLSIPSAVHTKPCFIPVVHYTQESNVIKSDAHFKDDDTEPASPVKDVQPKCLTTIRSMSKTKTKNDINNPLLTSGVCGLEETFKLTEAKIAENMHQRRTCKKTAMQNKLVKGEHCHSRIKTDSLESLKCIGDNPSYSKSMENRMLTRDLKDYKIKVLNATNTFKNLENDELKDKPSQNDDNIPTLIVSKGTRIQRDINGEDVYRKLGHRLIVDNHGQEMLSQDTKISDTKPNKQQDSDKINSKCKLTVDNPSSSHGISVRKRCSESKNLSIKNPLPHNWSKYGGKPTPTGGDGQSKQLYGQVIKSCNHESNKKLLVKSNSNTGQRVRNYHALSDRKTLEDDTQSIQYGASEEISSFEKKWLTDIQSLSKEPCLISQKMTEGENRRINRETFVVERHPELPDSSSQGSESKETRQNPLRLTKELALYSTNKLDMRPDTQDKLNSINHTYTLTKDSFISTEVKNHIKTLPCLEDALPSEEAVGLDKTSVSYDLTDFNIDGAINNELHVRQEAMPSGKCPSSERICMLASNLRQYDPSYTRSKGNDHTNEVSEMKKHEKDQNHLDAISLPFRCDRYNFDSSKRDWHQKTDNLMQDHSEQIRKLEKIRAFRLEAMDPSIKMEMADIRLLPDTNGKKGDNQKNTQMDSVNISVVKKETEIIRQPSHREQCANKTASVDKSDKNTLQTYYSTNHHSITDTKKGGLTSSVILLGPKQDLNISLECGRSPSKFEPPDHSTGKGLGLLSRQSESLNKYTDTSKRFDEDKNAKSVDQIFDKIRKKYSELQIRSFYKAKLNSPYKKDAIFHDNIVVVADRDNIMDINGQNKGKDDHFDDKQNGIQIIRKHSSPKAIDIEKPTPSVGRDRLLQVIDKPSSSRVTDNKTEAVFGGARHLSHEIGKGLSVQLICNKKDKPSGQNKCVLNVTGECSLLPVTESKKPMSSKDGQHEPQNRCKDNTLEVKYNIKDLSSGRLQHLPQAEEKWNSLQEVHNEVVVISGNRHHAIHSIKESGLLRAINTGTATPSADIQNATHIIDKGSSLEITDNGIRITPEMNVNDIGNSTNLMKVDHCEQEVLEKPDKNLAYNHHNPIANNKEHKTIVGNTESYKVMSPDKDAIGKKIKYSQNQAASKAKAKIITIKDRLQRLQIKKEEVSKIVKDNEENNSSKAMFTDARKIALSQKSIGYDAMHTSNNDKNKPTGSPFLFLTKNASNEVPSSEETVRPVLGEGKSVDILQSNVHLREQNKTKVSERLENMTNADTCLDIKSMGKRLEDIAFFLGSINQDVKVYKEMKNEIDNRTVKEPGQLDCQQEEPSYSHRQKTNEENAEAGKSPDKDLESLLVSEIKSAANAVGRHSIKHFFSKTVSKNRKRARSQEAISCGGERQLGNHKVPRLQDLKSLSCVRQPSNSSDDVKKTNTTWEQACSSQNKKKQLKYLVFDNVNKLSDNQGSESTVILKKNSILPHSSESKYSNLKCFASNSLNEQSNHIAYKEKMKISESRKVPPDIKFESFLKMKEETESRMVNNAVELIKHTHESSSTEAVISEDKHDKFEEYLKLMGDGDSPRFSNLGESQMIKKCKDSNRRPYAQRPFRRSGSQPAIVSNCIEDKPARSRRASTTRCRSLEGVLISEEYKSLSDKMSQLSRLISFDDIRDRTCPTMKSFSKCRSHDRKSTGRIGTVDTDEKSIFTGAKEFALKISESVQFGTLNPQLKSQSKLLLTRKTPIQCVPDDTDELGNIDTGLPDFQRQLRSLESDSNKDKKDFKPWPNQNFTKSPKFETALFQQKDKNRVVENTVQNLREKVKTSKSLPVDMNVDLIFPKGTSTETPRRHENSLWKNSRGRQDIMDHKSSASEASSDIDLSWVDSTMESTLTWLTDKMGNGNGNHLDTLPNHGEGEREEEVEEGRINQSSPEKCDPNDDQQSNVTQNLDINSNMYSNYFEPVNGLPSFTKSYVGDDLRAFLVQDLEKEEFSVSERSTVSKDEIGQTGAEKNIQIESDQNNTNEFSILSTSSKFESIGFDTDNFQNSKSGQSLNSYQFNCQKIDNNQNLSWQWHKMRPISELPSFDKKVCPCQLSELLDQYSKHGDEQISIPTLNEDDANRRNTITPCRNLLAWSQRYDHIQRHGQSKWFRMATSYRQCQSEVDEKEIRRLYQSKWDNQLPYHDVRENGVIKTNEPQPSTSRDTREAESYTIQRTRQEDEAAVDDEEGASYDSKSCKMGLDWYKPQARPVASTSAHSMRAASYRTASGSNLAPHNNVTDFQRQRPRPTPRTSKRKNPP